MKRFLTNVLLVLSTSAGAADLTTTRAERVGMSTDRLQRVLQTNQRYVDDGRIVGLSTAIARNGRIVHFETVGSRGADDPRPLTKDALFRIYSMSKPITATAAMQLYERGLFQLSDPVSKFVPELAELSVMKDGEIQPAKQVMTMQQLLSHTAGFSYGFNPNDPVDKLYIEADLWGSDDLDDFARRLGKLPLMFEPGERWHYSVAVDVTGLVVQRLSGQRFDEYLQEHIFAPLGMTDTFFRVPDAKVDRFLPSQYLDADTRKPRPLSPEGSPELGADIFQNCRAMCDYRDVTLFSGGGGLVSTTMDYLRWAEAMRNGGELDGVRILSPKTVAYMATNHLPASVTGGGTGEQPTLVGAALPGFGFGLGFGLVTDTAATSVMGSVGEFYWGGAAGTIFWIDPVEEVVVVSMMQLLGGWPSYRPDLKVATYQSLLQSYQ